MATVCTNQSLNPATVGIFMYMQLLYSYLVDVFVFHTNLNMLQFIGGGIIFVFTVAGAIHSSFATPTDKKSVTD